MKKLLLSIVSLLAICGASKGQSSSSATANAGGSTFTAGIGIGTPFFGSGYSSSLPVNPTITYEHAVADAFSTGGTLSYASSKYNYDGNDGFTIKESAFYIGARGSYHLNQLLGLGSNVDLYGGASIGYVVVTVSDNEGDSASAGSGVGFGLFAGGKYYFQPKFGVYAEVGYESLSYLNVGIAFKF